MVAGAAELPGPGEAIRLALQPEAISLVAARRSRMANPPAAGAEEDPIAVEVVRDLRLRKTIRWEWRGNQIRVRAPWHLRQDQLDRQVTEIVEKVKRKRAQTRARADV